MGLVTKISLQEAQELFAIFSFTKLTPTTEGIIDTTYIVENSNKKYILKKYENKTPLQLQNHIEFLNRLARHNLNVPQLVAESNLWFLFNYIKGEHPTSITYFNLRQIAINTRKIHNCTRGYYVKRHIFDRINILDALKYQKKDSFYYYKKYLDLKNMQRSVDGLIHGDIFPQNILITNSNIAIIDFIDAADGSLIFDLAVALSSLAKHPNRQHHIENFENFYNQTNHLISKTHAQNGINYLKGGDFENEIIKFKSKIKVFNIKDYFEEDFFETKKIIYLPR